MRRGGKKDERLCDQNILLDIRRCVIGVRIDENSTASPVTLSQYYKCISDGHHVARLHDGTSKRIDGDRAVDALQDAVRQLLQARKNSKASVQIKTCRQSVEHALQDTLRFDGSLLLRKNGVKLAADAIDTAIVKSIADRKIELIASRA